jgi:hypothetical protein
MTLMPLQALPESDTPGWFLLWLWDRTNSPRPELRAIPNQERYYFDSIKSEIIEFSRSYFAEGCLIRGRIWAEMSYWDCDQNPSQRIVKNESFQKLYNRMAGWIKRKGQKNKYGDYLMAGAAKFESTGGRLCQVNMGRNVKRIRH